MGKEMIKKIEQDIEENRKKKGINISFFLGFLIREVLPFRKCENVFFISFYLAKFAKQENLSLFNTSIIIAKLSELSEKEILGVEKFVDNLLKEEDITNQRLIERFSMSN